MTLKGVVAICAVLLAALTCASAVDTGYIPEKPKGHTPSYSHAHHVISVIGPPTDVLDLLYDRVKDATAQNNFLRESLDSVEARLTNSNIWLQQLQHIILTYLEQDESNQNASLSDLEDHYETLEGALNNLDASLDALSASNDANADKIDDLIVEYATALREDKRQGRSIASLLNYIRGLKEKLVWYMDNEFTLLNDRVENGQLKADTTTERALDRKCETGSVSLGPSNRRALYVFRNHFATAPGVVYSVSYLTNNVPLSSKPTFYIHGKPVASPPETIGDLVLPDVGKKSVTFRAVNFDFNGPTNVGLRVEFQVCSYPPPASNH